MMQSISYKILLAVFTHYFTVPQFIRTKVSLNTIEIESQMLQMVTVFHSIILVV